MLIYFEDLVKFLNFLKFSKKNPISKKVLSYIITRSFANLEKSFDDRISAGTCSPDVKAPALKISSREEQLSKITIKKRQIVDKFKSPYSAFHEEKPVQTS